jgi:predicted membrane protein
METRRDLGPMSPRLIFGLAIMAWGLILTLDNLGVIEARHYWKLWPVILIAVGLVRLAESLRSGFRLSGALLALVGTALLLHNLEIVKLKQIWPLILFVIGGSIVWKALNSGGRGSSGVAGDLGPSPEAGPPSNQLHAYTFMGGIHRSTNSQAFRGGTAMAVMGGCEIDLRHASLEDGQAVFDTFAMWGGVEIRVPEDWAVESHVVPLLGGFEDKTRQPADAKQRLVITGIAIMGGVGVKN